MKLQTTEETLYAEIRQAIVTDLSNYSADSIYNSKYPLFSHTKYGTKGDIKSLFGIIENSIKLKNEDSLIIQYMDIFEDDKKRGQFLRKHGDEIFVTEENNRQLVFKFIQISQGLLKKVNTIFEHAFFYEAKYIENYIETIDFSIVKKELLEILNKPIPKPKVFKIINSINEDLPKDAIVTDKELSSDNIAPYYMSLKKAIINNNVAFSEEGKIYLNFENGFYAKIITRKNTHNINPIVCIIEKEESLYPNLENPPIKAKENHGMYIISKNIIFEIYFDTDMILK